MLGVDPPYPLGRLFVGLAGRASRAAAPFSHR